MSDRLSPLDVSFLYLEQPSTPMHVGSVMIFRNPEGGLDADLLTDHLFARIAQVTRYRQRIRWIPGHLANPVWVDDENFDRSYHLRLNVLPRPGNDEQLEELVARLQAPPLDRHHPLWELYLVQGLSGGRFALVSKVHQALVDGIHAVDLGQLILDDTVDAAAQQADPGNTEPENAQLAERPSSLELVVDALIESVYRPGQLIDVARNGLADVRETAAFSVRSAGRVLRAARRLAGGPPLSPLTRSVTPSRRFAMLATDLADYRLIRAQAPAGTTVNDIVLTVLAGALRAWLLARGEPVTPDSIVRTLVPISVRADDSGDSTSAAPHPIASRVDSILVDLPTGEASPMMRLHQVSFQTKSHQEDGRAVRASALAEIAGFASPTLHSLGARVASSLSRRIFHLVVTNVPGPQRPLYVDGAQMIAAYPVAPLAAGQALSIGLTSYAGKVYYGLNADWEAMPDVDVVRYCIVDALAELQEAVR